MRSERVVLSIAVATLLLWLGAGAILVHRLDGLGTRQERSARALALARRIHLATDNADTKELSQLARELQATSEAPRLRELASALTDALDRHDGMLASEAAEDIHFVLLDQATRALERSGERTAALGENLLGVALIGGPLLAGLTTAWLLWTVHRPLRRAARAPSPADAARALSGLSGELALLLRDLDAERRTRLVDLLRAGHLAAIGSFAAEVAHEVRNPLTAISGIAQMSRRRLKAREVSELGDAFARIEEEAQRGGQLLGDLLNLAPKTPESEQRFDLIQEVREATRVAAARCHVEPAVIMVSAPDSLVLLGRPTSWRQILFNLLVNALDATLTAAHPAQTGQIEVCVSEADAQVTVEVRDRGRGFEGGQRRLFEPFFTTKRRGGSGLGLFICESLVRSEGGSIEGESEGVGKGAVFRVRVKNRA